MATLGDKKTDLEIELLEENLREAKGKSHWYSFSKMALVLAVVVPVGTFGFAVFKFLDDYRDAQRFRISAELLSIMRGTEGSPEGQARSALLLRQYGESEIPLLVYALATMPPGIGRDTAAETLIDLATENQSACAPALDSLADVSRLWALAEDQPDREGLKESLDPLLKTVEALKEKTKCGSPDLKWKSDFAESFRKVEESLIPTQSCDELPDFAKVKCQDREEVRARLNKIIGD